MKILHVSTPFLPVRDDLEYGGTERIVYLLDRELSKRGYDSYVAAIKTSRPAGTLYPTVEREIGISGVLDKEGGTEFEGLNSRLEHIAESLRYANSGFDVVHVHDDNMLPFMPMIRPPSLITLHSDYEGGFWNTHLHPRMVDLNVNLVAISKSQRRIYRSAGYNVDFVVYNGVDVDNFEFSERRIPYLLSLGSVKPEKGQHTAIEVGKRVGIDVVVAGNIGNQRYFDEMIQPHITHDISDIEDKLTGYLSLNSHGPRIVYTGMVNDSQKKPLYANALAFLMPIEWEEPFGLVMTEAMASGTPVIAYNRGSVPELVEDEKTGYIVESIDDMIGAVKNAERIRPEDCRQHVRDNFSSERMTEEYLKVYNYLTGSR